VIDVLDREIQLILVPFGIAAELAAAVSQHAQELDIVLLEERQHTVIEQIGRRDRRLAVVELGKADLGVGVDEGLLVDASNALKIADIERVLGAAVTWMLALELAVRLLSRSWPFPARRPAPQSAPGPLGRSWLVVSRIFRTFGLAERHPALAHAVMAPLICWSLSSSMLRYLFVDHAVPAMWRSLAAARLSAD
jgi:hypothetical protein